MKNGLLTPSISAICKAGGEAMHGRYKLPAMAKSIGRRKMRKVLARQGVPEDQARAMLKAMGFAETVEKGGKA
jgi:hypothetical protein